MRSRIFSTLLLFLSATGSAQQTKERTAFSSVGVTAGLSIPIRCYAARDPGKNTSGYARTGFSLQVDFSRYLNEYAGLKTKLYFVQNRLWQGDKSYTVFGWMAGPLFHNRFHPKWDAGLIPQVGISRVFMPGFETDKGLLPDERAWCFTWGVDLGVQYQAGKNSYILLQGGHLNMKPKLDGLTQLNYRNEQHLLMMTVDAGMRWRF